jgi:hypothetical protein
MLRRIVCAAICFGLVVIASGPSPAGQESAGEVTVEIVPSTFRMDRRWLQRKGFHVVVTNNTTKAIRLWKEWCSWGYFNLSFEARDKDGKLIKIARAERGWLKNYPDWIVVPPGEHFVIDVSFAEQPWTATPGPLPRPQQTIKLRAIYEISSDKETKQEGVWTGKVSSIEREYTLE